MGNSDPAWLAKDPAAQKHLGKLYQHRSDTLLLREHLDRESPRVSMEDLAEAAKTDANKSLWFVQAIDTGRQGDVVHLEHCKPRELLTAEEGKRKPVLRKVLSFTGKKRSIPLQRLESDYVVVQS